MSDGFSISLASAGAQGNAWNAAAVAIGGVSAAIDTNGMPFVTVFGNSSVASTIQVQYSQDGTNFYNAGPSISASGDFGTSFQPGARYVRLSSSAAATITATVAAK